MALIRIDLSSLTHLVQKEGKDSALIKIPIEAAEALAKKYFYT